VLLAPKAGGEIAPDSRQQRMTKRIVNREGSGFDTMRDFRYRNLLHFSELINCLKHTKKLGNRVRNTFCSRRFYGAPLAK
jgi:hypothetical protein